MPTIVEALKIKNPGATGNTIVDVLKSINGSNAGETIDQQIVNGESEPSGVTITPIVSILFTNNSSQTGVANYTTLSEEGHLGKKVDEEVPTDYTHVYECVFYVEEHEGELYCLEDFVNIISFEDAVSTEFSSEVNCTVEEGAIIVTDISKNASLTVVVSNYSEVSPK